MAWHGDEHLSADPDATLRALSHREPVRHASTVMTVLLAWAVAAFFIGAFDNHDYLPAGIGFILAAAFVWTAS